MLKRTIVGMLAAGTLLGVAGLAVGQEATKGTAIPVASDSPIVPPAGSGNFGAEHQMSTDALRAHLEPSGPDYLANVNWDAARSFAIPGTKLRGWVFERPGKRCLALPDPVAEGYGVTCKAPNEITAGEGTVVVRPPAESGAANIVGALTDDSLRPSIESPQGSVAESQQIDGVFVGTAPTGSQLVVGGKRQSIVAPPTVEIVSEAHGS